jgi:Raf kinase inhibitor-like YbhB/YbcL family protein
MGKKLILFLVLFTTAIACQSHEQTTNAKKEGEAMAIQVQSAAFKEGEMIPRDCTCDGKDVSPGLSWSDLPAGTKSVALICDDPDAPVGTWVHWVIYNIPPETKALPEGVPTEKTLDTGAVQGKNDWGAVGYRGPCPPGGTHRYFFKLYALDTMLGLEPGAAKKELLVAMENHILAKGQLMGKYKRR